METPARSAIFFVVKEVLDNKFTTKTLRSSSRPFYKPSSLASASSICFTCSMMPIVFIVSVKQPNSKIRFVALSASEGIDSNFAGPNFLIAASS
jgi:hypothetical protein